MKELAKKLLRIQKAIKPIVKDSTNPHFKNKYFDINSAIADLRPIFNEHGVVVLQPITNINGNAAISMILIEAESGEEKVFDPMPLPEGLDAQKSGAAITYYRRYALVSTFLLEAEDDDGNGTSSYVPPRTIAQKVEHPPAPFSDDQKPSEVLTDKECLTCGKPFTPKGAWAKDCFDCYKAKKA